MNEFCYNNLNQHSNHVYLSKENKLMHPQSNIFLILRLYIFASAHTQKVRVYLSINCQSSVTTHLWRHNIHDKGGFSILSPSFFFVSRSYLVPCKKSYIQNNNIRVSVLQATLSVKVQKQFLLSEIEVIEIISLTKFL